MSARDARGRFARVVEDSPFGPVQVGLVEPDAFSEWETSGLRLARDLDGAGVAATLARHLGDLSDPRTPLFADALAVFEAAS